MEVKGILLALIDVPPEDTEEYNRWYDLDHLAEHVSKRDVLTASRYVAPRDLQGLGHTDGDLTAGHPPYLTLYYLGVDDFASDEVAALWMAKDRVIVKAGRFWRTGGVKFVVRRALGETFTRPPVLVSSEAVPYLAHRGVVVAVGRAPSADRRDEAERWWRDTHLVDLLAVEGVHAAMRFDPPPTQAGGPGGQDEDGDLVVHLLLLQDDPAAVMPRVERAFRYARAVGRYPAHGGVYEPVAFLPYRRIVPLEYDFDW